MDTTRAFDSVNKAFVKQQQQQKQKQHNVVNMVI